MQLPTLDRVIETLSLSDRATLATLHACDETYLGQRLSDAAHWQQCYAQLNMPTRAVLERMRRAGGQCQASWLDGLAGPLRSNLTTLSPRTLLSIYRDHTPLEALFLIGVIWPIATAKGDMWVILPEIEAYLPAPAPILRAAPDDLHVVDDAPMLDEMMCQLACLAFDGRVPLQHHGKVSQVVAQRLSGAAVPATYVQWLVATLIAGGACIAEQNHVVPTHTMVAWFEMPAHLRAQEVARAWLQAAWSEWELGVKRRPPAIDVRAARRAAFHELVPQLPDTWIALSDLCQQMKQAWPDIFRNERTRLSIGWQTRWDDDDGALLTHLVAGPLWWLGIVERSQDGSCVRRTALGRWLAGIASPPHALPPAPAVLEADFSVVIPDPRNILARLQLHRIATWHDALTAQLSPQRVMQVVAKGMPINEYCAIVAQIVAPPVPPDMLATIRRWGADVAHVEMMTTVLIHAPTATVLHDISHDRRVHMPPHTWIGDTHIAVAPADAPPLARRLRAAGYIVETAQLRTAALSDDELALIERALQQFDEHTDAVRHVQARIMQLRMRGGKRHG